MESALLHLTARNNPQTDCAACRRGCVVSPETLGRPAAASGMMDPGLGAPLCLRIPTAAPAQRVKLAHTRQNQQYRSSNSERQNFIIVDECVPVAPTLPSHRPCTTRATPSGHNARSACRQPAMRVLRGCTRRTQHELC